MSSLLYYSISSDLTKDEIIEIELRTERQFSYQSSNSKRKAKRLFVYGMFLFQLGQPFVPCAAAVVMPLPPAIHRLSPIEQDIILSNKNGYPQIATIPESKVNKIRLTNDQIKEFNNLALTPNNESYQSMKIKNAITTTTSVNPSPPRISKTASSIVIEPLLSWRARLLNCLICSFVNLILSTFDPEIVAI